MKAKQKICPTCGELKYLWNKAIGCRGCVAKHKMSSETVKKLDKKPLKRSPLKKVANKRKLQEKEYSKKRKKHLENNPNCVSCGGVATEIHHRMQIRYGKFLNDESQFLSLCNPCHRYTHNNVEVSVQLGYLASKEEKAKYLRDNL